MSFEFAGFSTTRPHFAAPSASKPDNSVDRVLAELSQSQHPECQPSPSDSSESTTSEAIARQLRLLHLEQMSNLGQLVAGIAHEINNPASFIYGNLFHLRDALDNLLSLVQLYEASCPQPNPELQAAVEAIDLEFLKDDLPKMLASMEVGADRIRQIVLSLRNFSRLGESQLKSVDLHDGLDSTLTFLKNRLQARQPYPHIQILSEYGDVPPVECYAGQLNQVFLVTLGRAIDAIEDAYSIAHPSLTQEPPHPFWATGEVRVGVARPGDEATPREYRSAKNSPQCQPRGKIRIGTHRQGDFALVSIADNGLGIVEKVRRYLSDPSFAIAPKRQTKTLSLAIAHQIVVEQHGGKLKCSFHAERGNQLTIALPISQSSPPPTPCGRENCDCCDRLRC